MHHEPHQDEVIFTHKAAWLGAGAYIMLAVIFMFVFYI